MNWIQTRPDVFRRFPPASQYLIGVSGGRDSVALLHGLVDFGYKKLIVCHLNHQLRKASEADVRFVKRLAKKYDVDIELGSTNVANLARKRKISVETAGREARYSFFARIIRRRQCRTIFLAHHADDLVETFLLNLFRGSGVTGLAAMREVSERRVDDVALTIVRPLLAIWRTEIDSYIHNHRLQFREDASNKSLGPMRNRMRHRVIPYLERNLGRSIRQSLWRTAAILAEEENWIDNQSPDAAAVDLEVRKLRDLPIALQRREIRKWLRAQNVVGVGFDIVERVRSLLNHHAVAKVNLPRGRHVRRRARKIFIAD